MLICLCMSMCMYGQITIMPNDINKQDKFIYKYDSLSNIKIINKQKPLSHLVGQKVLYCNWWGHTKLDNAKGLEVGKYYQINDVLEDKNNKNFRLSLVDCITKETFEIYERRYDKKHMLREYNSMLVVVGYYEKLKELFVGKEFIYLNNMPPTVSIKTPKDLISLDTDTVTLNIKYGSTIWTCIDVQVRMYNEKDMFDFSNVNPIVFIFENEKYGKHYYYQSTPYQYSRINFKEQQIGDFILYSYYLEKEKEKKEKNDIRRKELVTKYGSYYANLIMNSKICIGMTKDMCIESWGKPQHINTTTTASIEEEQWVYWDNYVYFSNGKITAIQN